MQKKERERIILHEFFSIDCYGETEVDCESPDFLLHEKPAGEVFGVEVTEHFSSETDARFARLGMYVSSLLSGGPPRHKDDKGLAIESFSLLSPDGKPVSEFKGIKRETQQQTSLAALAKTIEKKGAKLPSFRSDVSHHNLLIKNRSTLLSSSEAGDVFAELFASSELRQAVTRSPFREVLFLSSLKNEQRVCIPLKQLLVCGHAFLYGQTIARFVSDGGEEGICNLEPLAKYLKQEGASIYKRGAGEEIELFFGNCSIAEGENRRISLTCYFEAARPGDYSPVSDTLTPGQDELVKALQVTVSTTTVRDIPLMYRLNN